MGRGKLSEPQFETEEVKCVVQSVFAPHSKSGLYSSQLHLVEHLIEYVNRFGSPSLTDAARFENSTVLVKRASRTKSCRL